jgi:hypothetical protein
MKLPYSHDELLHTTSTPDYDKLEVIEIAEVGSRLIAICKGGDKYYAVSGGSVRFCMEGDSIDWVKYMASTAMEMK